MESEWRKDGFLLFVFISCAIQGTNQEPVSPFGKFYTVSATLYLPYAEIEEPLFAAYDSVARKSSIKYYDDTVVTIQIGAAGNDSGKSYKIAPITVDIPGRTKKNVRTCFLVNGTKSDPIGIQSVLPDLTGFSLIGKDTCPGSMDMRCHIWQNVTQVGSKKNTYTMYIEISSRNPLKYEMIGYDTLLGSHYDKYSIVYRNFNNKTQPKPEEFNIPKGMQCGDFGGADVENLILANPMREFVQQNDSHVHHMFNKFKVKHGKRYEDQTEHETRKHTFRQNLRFIHSKNRAGLSFTLAVNHLADRTSKELKLMNGYRHTPGYNGGLPFYKELYSMKQIPDSLDWRLYGAVTPVKDQAVCGSCWSFGTVGSIEGAYFLKTGQLVRLSEQELVDCSWGEGNNGCDGGEDFTSYQWIMRNGGLATDESYGPYKAIDGLCHAENSSKVAVLKGYVNVTSEDGQALRIAMATHGPISVAIDASHRSLSFYSNGIYYEPKCGNKPDDLDHAVLAVGYGVLNTEPYWLIKNSWSTYWGNDGYVLMSQRSNNCGVATSPTFVLM